MVYLLLLFFCFGVVLYPGYYSGQCYIDFGQATLQPFSALL